MKIYRYVILLITILIISVNVAGCEQTDEGKINSKISKFVNAYNSGNLDAALDCLDSASASGYRSALRFLQTLSDDKISFSDLFGIGVGFSSKDGELISIKVENIEINETKANVKAKFSYKDNISSSDENITIKMIKQGNDWFINDIN